MIKNESLLQLVYHDLNFVIAFCILCDDYCISYYSLLLNPFRASGGPQVSDETSPCRPILSSPPHVVLLKILQINFACESASPCVLWSADSSSPLWPPVESLFDYPFLGHSENMAIPFPTRKLDLFDDALLTRSSSQLFFTYMFVLSDFQDSPQTNTLEPAYSFFSFF